MTLHPEILAGNLELHEYEKKITIFTPHGLFGLKRKW